MRKETKLAARVLEQRKPKHNWYDFITPLLGIKWGAEITLIGYTWIERADSDGLRAAAITVTVFLFLEWCQMAWCEFKRRAQ
jgi:hypothetical protein